MATTLTAGNATNGAVIVGDNTGILELKTGTGSGTTALTLSTAQAATFAGAVTSSGLITGATGALYPIVSGTTITLTNQTAPEFASIPSWAKRITLMFNGVSPNSTGTLLVQLGTDSGYETTDYGSSMTYIVNATAATSNSSTGFLAGTYGSASAVYNGLITLATLGGNVWVASCNLNDSSSARTFLGSGAKTLSGGALTKVRLYIDGTQQFDAGSINILWE
jgi:hypothetical protein